MVDGLQHGWGQCSPVGLICPDDKMRLGFGVELSPMAEGEAGGKVPSRVRPGVSPVFWFIAWTRSALAPYPPALPFCGKLLTLL